MLLTVFMVGMERGRREGTKVHLAVRQRLTHRNGLHGMRGMRAYSTKFNAGMLTHRNGMLGMSYIKQIRK